MFWEHSRITPVCLANRPPSPAWAMTSKQRKREARKLAEAAKPAPPAYFGLFNPTATSDDPEWDIFSESTGILQRLQQLQLLHRESDLLDLLHGCLMGPALDWFKNQPGFTSLHEFGIALTSAFPPKQNDSSSRSILAPKSRCEISENSAESDWAVPTAPPASFAPQKQQKMDRCQWCQLHYEIWDSHRLQYPSCAARNKQAYESALQFLEGHASEVIKKSAVSTPPDPQEQHELKSTPELQDIGIFDPTLTYEDRRFSEATDFLQHLQQCQYQYRESDLLFLLPSCLYGPAFDIWFDKQTTMESASLNEWIETLRVDFAAAAFAKPKVHYSTITCMRCDSSFNSKEKLREHVREQHAKKSVNSSSLLNNTAKSICKTMEKSAVTDLPAPPALQESNTSAATLKQIPESTMTSGTVTSPQDSHLTFSAPETVPESVENESNQYSSVSLFPFSQTFEPEHQQSYVQEPPGSWSSLTNLTPKLVCETEEKPAAIEASALQAPLISQKSPILPLVFKRSCPTCRIDVSSVQEHYLESPSCHEALRNRIEHQLALHAYQPKQEAQKQAEDSHLSVYAVNSVCEIEETSSTPHKFLAPKPMSESAIAPRTVTLLERPNLSFPTPGTMSKSTERSATCRRCNKIFNSNNKLHEHIRQNHARKPVKSSDLRVSAPELTYKPIEKPASICPPALLAPQKSPTPPATPRSQISWFSINSEPVAAPTRSDLPIATYKISPKPLESAVASCPLTPPTSPSQAPVRKHQKPHNEPYLTLDDLNRMFHGKPRPFGLRQHHNRRSSPQDFGFRQSSQPCSSTPKKPCLTMHNLGRMFDGKSRRKGLFQSQNHESSQASSGQMQITAYFKPTANQKPPINQTSKGSKPKTSKQHMPAESIRTAFSRSLPEKLADLPYKLPDISCHLKPSNPNKAAEAVSFISILLRLLPAFLLALAFVSAISAARMGCISAYQQAISALAVPILN